MDAMEAARMGQGITRPADPEATATSADAAPVGLERSVRLATQQGHRAGRGGAVGGGGRGAGLVRRQVVAGGSCRGYRCTAAAAAAGTPARDAGVDVRGRPRGQQGRRSGVNRSLNGRSALGRVIQAEGRVCG